MFRILGINHVGLAPKDPAAAAKFFRENLGLSFVGEEFVASQLTNTIMFSSAPPSPHSEAPRLEILEAKLGADGSEGPITKFLAKKGSGIHHIALSVDNLDAALSALKTRGVKMIDTSPRPGAHNTRIAFIHPEATGGLLVELVEESKA